MRHAWTIAAKDLRRRFRDRTALLVAFVLPFGLAWIFRLTLGDIETQGFEATYAVADLDTSGHIPSSFTDVLTGLDFVTLREADSPAQVERLAEDGDIDGGVVFPEGFSAQVQSGEAATLRVIGSPDSSVGSLVLVSLARSFGSQLDAIAVSVATVGSPGAADPALVARAREVKAAASVGTVDAADQVASQSTFFAIGMAVFFLFFAVEFGVRGLLEEREEGTLDRLLGRAHRALLGDRRQGARELPGRARQHDAARGRLHVDPRRDVGRPLRGRAAGAGRGARGGRGDGARGDAGEDARRRPGRTCRSWPWSAG